jgi:hypothetical protein
MERRAIEENLKANGGNREENGPGPGDHFADVARQAETLGGGLDRLIFDGGWEHEEEFADPVEPISDPEAVAAEAVVSVEKSAR